MNYIENYMNDGACWQAQAVLAYIRDRRETILDAGEYDEKARQYDCYITVGRFENCREQGYVFSVHSWKHGDKQGNWVVYEHRNVDHVCAAFFNERTVNTPTLDEVTDHLDNDVYCEKKDFKYDVQACWEWIEQDMKEWIEDVTID